MPGPVTVRECCGQQRLQSELKVLFAYFFFQEKVRPGFRNGIHSRKPGLPSASETGVNTIWHIKIKNPRSTSVAFPFFFCRETGLPLADGGIALTENHVVNIDTGERLDHVRYHFLPISNCLYYNTAEMEWQDFFRKISKIISEISGGRSGRGTCKVGDGMVK